MGSRRAPFRVGLVVLLGALLTGAQARAESDSEFSREGFYVALAGVFAAEDGKGQFTNTNDTGGISFLLGYRVAPPFGMEWEGTWMDGFEPRGSSNTNTVGSFIMNFKLYPVEMLGADLFGGILQPYLIAAPGLEIASLRGDPTLGGHFGGGLGFDIYVTENVGINTNVQYVGGSGDVSDVRYIRAYLGGMYRW